MSSSVHPPDPLPTRPVSRPLWSLKLSASPRGLSVARETGSLLAWDEKGSLYLVNRSGELQGRTRLASAVVSANFADDGSACAAVGERGEVWWLTPDLMPRWEKSVPRRAAACALDPFGHFLAATDAQGGVHLFDHAGKVVGGAQTPRPLVHLAFVPEAPRFVGSADMGFVACFDSTCRSVWRNGLVSNVGALTVSGDGSRIVLACYSDGLRCFSLDGKKQARLPVVEPCRLVASSYDGRRLLVGSLSSHLLLLDGEGQSISMHPLDAPAVALGLGALGETAFAALSDGRVVALGLT